MNLVNTVNTCN